GDRGGGGNAGVFGDRRLLEGRFDRHGLFGVAVGDIVTGRQGGHRGGDNDNRGFAHRYISPDEAQTSRGPSPFHRVKPYRRQATVVRQFAGPVATGGEAGCMGAGRARGGGGASWLSPLRPRCLAASSSVMSRK